MSWIALDAHEGEGVSEPLPLGMTVEPYGKVSMIATLDGERYYWLVDRNGVSLMPGFVIEERVRPEAGGEEGGQNDDR